MPLIPEEPQIRESVPGPRVGSAGGRTAQAPRPVPGPRPAAPRPVPPQRGGGRTTHPAPGRPAPSRAPAAQPGGGRETAKIELVPARTGTALDVADETVDRLLDSGRPPGDILVLVTGEPHPWQSHELSFGEESYWRQHDEGGDVFYALAGAERTGRRAVVVLAVNGGTDEEAARALPAALSRAAGELIVVGDPDRLRKLLED
jgi:hypothetical protein